MKISSNIIIAYDKVLLDTHVLTLVNEQATTGMVGSIVVAHLAFIPRLIPQPCRPFHQNPSEDCENSCQLRVTVFLYFIHILVTCILYISLVDSINI